jgi:galactokinase
LKNIKLFKALEAIPEIDDYFRNQIGGAPACRGYAPGRIEVLGNHTDYNGGNVLGAAVNKGIYIGVRKRNDSMIRLCSQNYPQPVTLNLNNVCPQAQSDSWANYPLGVVQVLRDEGYPVDLGFDFAATSSLPSGSGMSSSAALELATACALADLFDFELDRKTLARIGRRAENEFVGVPCGILDQGVSAFGDEDCLVHIDCFTESFRQVAFPKGCEFWIFNSNKTHALVESSYADRHQECVDAFKILQQATPQAACLAQIHPETVVAERDRLGEVRFRRALHVTQEDQRVRSMIEALRKEDLNTIGRLLCASHESSRTLFENSTPELDALVESVVNQPGVYGARLTGGGFGGAVMAMTEASFAKKDGASIVYRDFSEKFHEPPTIFNCQTGQGACILK